MSESEAKTAVGKRVGIMEKNGGWTQFVIDVGRQYPLKLDTKIPAVVEACRAFGEGTGVWHYNESPGNPNPNKPGTFYPNRYLSKVEPVTGDGQSSTHSAADGGSEERMTKTDWDNKERRDYRSRAWAQTLSLFTPHVDLQTLLPEQMDLVFGAMQTWQRKIYHDVTGNFSYPDDESDLPF